MGSPEGGQRTRVHTAVSSVVYLVTVPECHEDDEEHVIGHGVEDAVVPDLNPEAGTALQGHTRRVDAGRANTAMAPP